MLYINAPTAPAGASSVTAGLLLNKSGGGFQNLNQNQITFTNVANVVAALADFDGDRSIDYCLRADPVRLRTDYLCVYYGTGADLAQLLSSVGTSSYNAGVPANAYPPVAGGKSGCMTFALQGSKPPNFSPSPRFPGRPASPSNN